MDYYEHSGQDSAVWEYWQKNDQIRFLINHSNFRRRDSIVLNFRIQNLYGELSSKGIKSIKGKVFYRYMRIFLYYSPFKLFVRFIAKKVLMM